MRHFRKIVILIVFVLGAGAWWVLRELEGLDEIDWDIEQ